MPRCGTALVEVTVKLYPDRLDRQDVPGAAIRQRRADVPIARDGLVEQVVNDQRLFGIDAKLGFSLLAVVFGIVYMDTPFAPCPEYRLTVPGGDALGRCFDNDNLAGRVVVLGFFRGA